jgi:hypothetical protein
MKGTEKGMSIERSNEFSGIVQLTRIIHEDSPDPTPG